MRIGYACLTIGVQEAGLKTCNMKNADATRLTALIESNLRALEKIIDYNIANDIRLFRISSDLIPFGSSPVNPLIWWEIFHEDFLRIGEKVKQSGIRVSMHPGQYTVINSNSDDVVQRAILDLEYHARVLDSMALNNAHKIILHIGGVYNDKATAIKRFNECYQTLSDAVQRRLVIENDDKSYTISEVLQIGENLNIPVVFDNLHNQVNPSAEPLDDVHWIKRCQNTWKAIDGPQKIHYSQQDLLKPPGAHSTTIKIRKFMNFYEDLNQRDLDIMLEVKDKNLSAVKCILCTTKDLNAKEFEVQWGLYKYSVMENSQEAYKALRHLMGEKETGSALLFYEWIEKALETQATPVGAVNAALHVWGYFKEVASEKETAVFLRDIKAFSEGKKSLSAVKNNLWRLTVKYNEGDLLNSLYFFL